MATLKARDVVSQNGGYDWNPHIPLIFTGLLENFYLVKTETKSERSEEKLDITGKIRYSNSNFFIIKLRGFYHIRAFSN